MEKIFSVSLLLGIRCKLRFYDFSKTRFLVRRAGTEFDFSPYFWYQTPLYILVVEGFAVLV